MLRMMGWYKLGWYYLPLVFVLEETLPSWTGVENGLIENIQMLVLGLCWWYCSKLPEKLNIGDWGGDKQALGLAGQLFFFLLIMREINWGRAFFWHADGTMYSYAELGLYGAMVHPMVAILIVVLLYLLYKCKIWRLLQATGFNITTVVLLGIYVVVQWLAEHGLGFFHGEVGEELAELGAYMVMYHMMGEIVSCWRNKNS